jgi:hypothetical protein
MRRRATFAALIAVGVAVWAAQVVPGAGEAAHKGQTKVFIYDNTHNNWNVTTNDPVTGGPDPIIGFVNYRPTTPDDPTHIILNVVLKNAAPNCAYSVQLIPQVFDPTAGLPPDGGRHGSSTAIMGDIATNKKGKGTAQFVADATLLEGTAPSGQFTYAHIDIEDVDQDCVEADGTNVEENEYGASGKQPGSPLNIPVNIHWLQP